MKRLFLLCVSLPLVCFSQQFTVEETVFTNAKDTVSLAATLTIPTNRSYPPVAILISGSGQTDRDETIFNHKLFKELAEYLSNRGIAVVRYDDRGGFKSTGRNVANSTSYELSEDAEAIFGHLRKDARFLDSPIGFIGHSEGGMIAPMIAARNKEVDFVVSLAGTAVSGTELLLKQNRDIYQQSGVADKHIDLYFAEVFEPTLKAVADFESSTDLKKEIIKLVAPYREKAGVNSLIPAVFSNELFADRLIAQIGGVWGRYFLATDPAGFWEKVTCPVLALNGDKDLQVNMEQNLARIKKVLEDAGNKQVKIVAMPAHNHLFQVAKTGSILEYGQLKTGMSEETMNIVTEWILGLN